MNGQFACDSHEGGCCQIPRMTILLMNRNNRLQVMRNECLMNVENQRRFENETCLKVNAPGSRLGNEALIMAEFVTVQCAIVHALEDVRRKA
ncbi:hypothetical protein Q3G72_015742 [Acer saccharum]|nr:hypothetical protein Q3G72_015742 [Acer saccharum]